MNDGQSTPDPNDDTERIRPTAEQMKTAAASLSGKPVRDEPTPGGGSSSRKKIAWWWVVLGGVVVIAAIAIPLMIWVRNSVSATDFSKASSKLSAITKLNFDKTIKDNLSSIQLSTDASSDQLTQQANDLQAQKAKFDTAVASLAVSRAVVKDKGAEANFAKLKTQVAKIDTAVTTLDEVYRQILPAVAPLIKTLANYSDYSSSDIPGIIAEVQTAQTNLTKIENGLTDANNRTLVANLLQQLSTALPLLQQAASSTSGSLSLTQPMYLAVAHIQSAIQTWQTALAAQAQVIDFSSAATSLNNYLANKINS